MNNNLTDIIIVLDRSGSMANVQKDMEGGLNQFVDDQKKLSGEVRLTFVRFDEVYEEVLIRTNIKDVWKLDLRPRGCTALLDAIGKTINETGNRFSQLAEKDRPSKIVFMVVTDGYENASKEFTKTQIKDMIELQASTYNWEFVFLGADQDAIQEGSSLGVYACNSMTYNKTSAGIKGMWNATSNKTAMFASGQCVNMAYDDEDRKNAMS